MMVFSGHQVQRLRLVWTDKEKLGTYACLLNSYFHRIWAEGFEEIKKFLEARPLLRYCLPTFHEHSESFIRAPLGLREILKADSGSFRKRQCILNDLFVRQDIEWLLSGESEYFPNSYTKRPDISMCGKCP